MFHRSKGSGAACRRMAALLFAGLLAAAGSVPRPCLAESLAITFDDLPLNGTLAPDMTRSSIVKEVLAVLKKRHVPPVYGFVTAKGLENEPDGAAALKAWVAGGQQVGNHSYSHFDLSRVTSDVFLKDVHQNEPVLELLSPARWRWFRYPFLREGDTLEKRRAVRKDLAERGYRIAQVTIDWEDYLWNSPYARCSAKRESQSLARLRSDYLTFASAYIDADRQMAQLIFGRPMSHVLLLHLGAFSSAILPDLLDLLQKKGFTLVTLEEALRDPAYQSDPDAANATGGTLLEQWLDARKMKYPSVPAKPYKELAGMCGADLVTMRFPPLPTGYRETDGACLRLSEDPAHPCDYAFGVLTNDAEKKRLLYGARSEGLDAAGKPKWEVLDSVDISELPRGYRMTLSECYRDGAVDETVVAAVREAGQEDPWFRDILWAKRLDLARKVFIAVSLANVRCRNVGMG
jgi:peptidoglycan-N-acetylglucosamine deacetylase